MLNTYYFNLKTFFTQPLQPSFKKRKRCVKFHFSVCNERRIINAAPYVQKYKNPKRLLIIVNKKDKTCSNSTKNNDSNE